MTSQVKSHHPIMTRQRRDPLKPSLGTAHRSVQEKDRVGLAPRIGKVVDVIGKLESVRRAEGAIHGAHGIVASRMASAHARSYSSRLIHSSMVCTSFWPAPKVTV